MRGDGDSGGGDNDRGELRSEDRSEDMSDKLSSMAGGVITESTSVRCGHAGDGGEWWWDNIDADSPVGVYVVATVKERRRLRSTMVFGQ